MCRRAPTKFASRISRAIIDSSATDGQPLSPKVEETTPSCICAPSVKRGSCACWAMTPSNCFTYSRARLITNGSETQFPSSLKTLTFAFECAIDAKSANSLPSSPLVTAPIGKTSTKPTLAPIAETCSTIAAESATGKVFAMALTATYPPRAAASDPVAIVSEFSLPGSRR